MGERSPFVLLDDARESGAADAMLYEAPIEVFAAYHPGDVADVLAKAEAARADGRGTLAGYIAYEAGLALEPKLGGLADARNGAFNAQAGFDLAGCLLSSALPRSGHLNVRTPEADDPPWKQLVIHNGRGGGLKRMRETLKGIAGEIKKLVDA